MDARLIDPATFRIGSAQRQMDRPTNFFVDKYILAEAVDVGIHTKRKLSQTAGSGVRLQNAPEKVFVAMRRWRG